MSIGRRRRSASGPRLPKVGGSTRFERTAKGSPNADEPYFIDRTTCQGYFVQDYFVTWPLISPGRLAAVWMLTYQRPAVRSAAWASVKVAEPLAGLVGLVPISTARPDVLSGSAGTWK